MNFKRFGAVICLIAGAVLLFVAFYIKGQVEQGREQISDAQNKVDRTGNLFSASPYTKPVGSAITGAAQKKIDAGSAEAARYEEMAHWLDVGGVILLVAGAGLFFYFRKKA